MNIEDIKTKSIKYIYCTDIVGYNEHLTHECFRQKLIDFFGEWLHTDVKVGLYSTDKSRQLELTSISNFFTRIDNFILRLKEAYPPYDYVTIMKDSDHAFLYIMQSNNIDDTQ